MPTANPFEYKFKTVETLSSDRVIRSNLTDGSSDSGRCFLCSAALTVTLPTPRVGLHYKFIITADLTSAAALVLVASGGAKMAGAVLTAQGTAVGSFETEVTGDGSTKFTVGSTGNNVLAGSYVECFSDGTDWYLSGIVGGDNADINACAFGS